MRRAFFSITKIATQLGVSVGAASQWVKEMHQDYLKLHAEDAAETARIDLARTEDMLNALWPAVMAGDTKSATVANRILERRARMLGYDQPLKTNLTLQTPQDFTEARSELERLVAERGAELPPPAMNGHSIISQNNEN